MVANITNLIKKETVLLISSFCALLSCFFVHPDSTYLGYIDYRTLAILFCLMVVVAGLKQNGLFSYLSTCLLRKLKNQRQIVLALVFLCFFGSMFMTNDVSLITFVPFGILVLEFSGMEASTIQVVTMMTIAANLGSMLTPVGNPQNLYLYSASGLSFIEFLKITGPYCLIAATLLFGFSSMQFHTKKVSAIDISSFSSIPFNQSGIIFYLFLFGICILAVLRWFPVVILFCLIFTSILWKEMKLLLKVDYSLLATFVFLFVFIGNMGRLPAFRSLIEQILNGHEILTSVGISQIISNVPAAILLSGFSSNWKDLLIGTNLGGLGTLIASMASLISYKQIAAANPDEKGRYLLVFTGWNLLFLCCLLLVAWM